MRVWRGGEGSGGRPDRGQDVGGDQGHQHGVTKHRRPPASPELGHALHRHAAATTAPLRHQPTRGFAGRQRRETGQGRRNANRG